MERGRGTGIFFGIVSIATLIVAIMGATFAYFSASITSETNSVGAQAYEFVNAKITVEQVYPDLNDPDIELSGLIPLNPATPVNHEKYKNNLEYALNVAENKCIDDYGYQVCVLFRVIIENSGKQEIKLSGQLKTTLNEPGNGTNATRFTNLTYQAIDVEHSEVPTDEGGTAYQINAITISKDSESTPIKPETIKAEPNTEKDSTVPISGVNVTPAVNEDRDQDGEVELIPGIGVSYVLIYLNDSGDQSAEMGARFEGQLIYTSGSGNANQLTGTFKVG